MIEERWRIGAGVGMFGFVLSGTVSLGGRGAKRPRGAMAAYGLPGTALGFLPIAPDPYVTVVRTKTYAVHALTPEQTARIERALGVLAAGQDAR